MMGLTPGHHSEAVKSRRDFLFLAAQVVESGRRRVVKLAVKAEWWTVLKACYERLRTWLSATAPQFGSGGRILAPARTPDDRSPGGNPASTRLRLNLNCEI